MPVDDKLVELVSDKPVDVQPLIAERKDVAACVMKVVCVDTGVQTDDILLLMFQCMWCSGVTRAVLFIHL